MQRFPSSSVCYGLKDFGLSSSPTVRRLVFTAKA